MRFIFPDYVRRAIIRATEGIDSYQVVQTEANHLNVRLELRPDADPRAGEAVLAGLRQMYAQHDCLSPDIDLDFGPPRLHPESKKLRRVFRTCDIPR
jgi:phenylacetate-coenzyme A ligase PaaK-like adenylate-forming protein